MFNLNLGYNWGKYKLRLGIENLLDKDPPVYGTNPGVDTNSDATQPGFYDTLGRRYYVGVKASF